jgi:hypothetical protein
MTFSSADAARRTALTLQGHRVDDPVWASFTVTDVESLPQPHILPSSQPGRHGPRLLGSAWVGGVRDGSTRARHIGPAVGDGAPSIPVPADPPPEALF